jgi:hypothetical protein
VLYLLAMEKVTMEAVPSQTPSALPEKPGWNSLFAWFEAALAGLGLSLAQSRVESLAVGVFTAMGGPLRRFHALDHIFRFQPSDPLETLAILYHDVVYWSVDGCWPPGFDQTLGAVAVSGLPGTRLAAQASIPCYGEILSVFGLAPGDPVGKTGANELFSTLAFASALGADLGRDRTLAVAACIEGTIPFRGPGARTALHARLMDLGFSRSDADTALIRAVHMANQDVGDFRHEDAGTFLGGTWNLLPELNPDLRITAVFSVQAYRRALEGMDRFFAFLTPEVLFDSWLNEPGPEVLAQWRAQAAVNLRVARDYLGAKLLAASLLEAFALATGPDVPLSLLMGAASAPQEHRLEARLPALQGQPEMEPVYFLLEWGRSTAASFDLTNSPLAAWVYRQLDPPARKIQSDHAKELFSGRMAPRDFLATWPRPLVSALAKTLATFVPTRSEGLQEWVS